MFVRSSESTPIINRSGQAFHVSLFSGPDLRSKTSGGFYVNQFICTFGYVQDPIGPERKILTLYVVPATRGRKELLHQMEIAADRIAELLEDRRPLEPAYTVKGEILSTGVPR